MKKLLLTLILISHTAYANNNYIEIGVSNVGSWNSIPTGALIGLEGLPFPDFIDNSNRSRGFISFHKALNDSFYLLGSYAKTKSTPPSAFSHTEILKERVSTLGVGYSHLLKNYEMYVELVKYKYTKSYDALSLGWILGHSEIISAGSALKRYGNMYKLGLIKELSSDINIDISYSSYQDITFGNSKHRNKSIKLIKNLNEKLSLVFNYDEDGDGKLFKRTNRSLSLRTKF